MLPKLTELKFISEYIHRFDEFFKTSVHQKTDFEIFLKNIIATYKEIIAGMIFKNKNLLIPFYYAVIFLQLQ